MRRTARRRIALLTAAVIGLVSAAGAHAQIAPARGPIPAYVTRVVDGDTIYVMIGDQPEAVRYIGIVAPAMRHPTLGRSRYGEAAYAANVALVEGGWVSLVLDDEQRDGHGRLLAYVWVAGRLVNAELVQRGYAQAATAPVNARHAEYFKALERAAREAGRGLWAEAAAEEEPSLPDLKSESAEATTGTSLVRTFSAPMPRAAPASTPPRPSAPSLRTNFR